MGESQENVIDFMAHRRRKGRLNEPWIDKHQIAQHFGVSPRTIYRWVRSGCPVHPLRGGALRFVLSEVVEWHDQRA